ncbi:MAG: hypothetical protein P8Y28_00945 [Gammaproteobacteria bacterium]
MATVQGKISTEARREDEEKTNKLLLRKNSELRNIKQAARRPSHG